MYIVEIYIFVIIVLYDVEDEWKYKFIFFINILVGGVIKVLIFSLFLCYIVNVMGS